MAVPVRTEEDYYELKRQKLSDAERLYTRGDPVSFGSVRRTESKEKSR